MAVPKVLRIEPILPMSTLSTAAAGMAIGGVTCWTDGSVFTEDSLFAGFRADTFGTGADSLCSSTEGKMMELITIRVDTDNSCFLNSFSRSQECFVSDWL